MSHKMQRFLICSGLDGRPEALAGLQSLVRARRPDGLLFAGGVLAHERKIGEDFNADHYSIDAKPLVQRFFSTLGSLEVFCAVIPGVFDAPLDEFLRLGMAAELEYPMIHLAHVTPVKEGHVTIYGLGACITDYTSPEIGYYSETLAHYYLRPLLAARQRWTTVLLLSDLPQGWHGDRENERRVTVALNSTYHPAVCVLGGPSVKGRIEHVGDTLLIYPGHLADGWGAWLDLTRPKNDQVELLDLRCPGIS